MLHKPRLPLSTLIPCAMLCWATGLGAQPAPESPAPEHAARELVLSQVSHFGGGMQISRVACANPDFAPLAWAGPRARGGDKLGLQGTLPVPGWLGLSGRGRVVVWGAHEGFFGAGPDGQLDNDRLRENILAWLLDGGNRLGCTSTHKEWLTADGLSPVLRAWLDSAGVSHNNVGTALSADVLREWDCLVVGNPWVEFTPVERNALVSWVHQGGGLLLLGLGWSWHDSFSQLPLSDYPVNQLAQRFRCQVLDGTISDPDAPNRNAAQPSFGVLPLSGFNPAQVAVLRANETSVDRVQQLAREAPADIYVVEGEYTALQLPAADWLKLDSPSRMIEILDSAYLAELELVGGANRAYGGARIWYVAADDPTGGYWMHSGNPIVFKQEAGGEIVKCFNNGWPGWGMLHEQGHNMVISACNNIYVHHGTAEPWCNVFTVWAIHRMGWPQRDGAFDAGHAYHAQAQPDFAQLTSDPWILLGCLELVWSRYGWDGMQRFMTRAASDAAAGQGWTSNAAATAYFVEQLSAAYQRDFAPLIAHWGFPVSDASREITRQYPAAEISW